jgi:hypothetical protein
MSAEHPSLTPLELAAAGQALFGVHWRGEVARRLGVTEAEVRLIERGTMPVPPSWRARLIGLAQDVSLRAMQIAAELMWDETRVEAAAVKRSA